jgi:predicted permease
MLLHILTIIAPVAACAAVGFIWKRTGRPYDAPFVTRLVMNVGAPFLIVSSFQRVQPDIVAVGRVALAASAVTLATAAAALVALRLMRADVRTYLPSISFQNTGNMGLPLCLFAFGEVGMTMAIVVFMWVSLANFTAGVAIASGERNLLRVARTPLVWATILSVGLSVAGVTLPAWIRNTADILGGLTIPMMLITLGVSLAGLEVRTVARSVLIASMRFGFGFAAGWMAAEVFGLDGIARGVVILQSSMPPAVFNYLIAARYERNEAEVAGVVVVGTVMSAAVVPAVLWFLLRQG